jgi:hypothetical protein
LRLLLITTKSNIILPRKQDEEAQRSAASCMTCSICTEPYLQGAILRQLPCDHEFHQGCVDPWLLTQSATCPLWYVVKAEWERDRVSTNWALLNTLSSRVRVKRLEESPQALPASPRSTYSLLERWNILRREARVKCPRSLPQCAT